MVHKDNHLIAQPPELYWDSTYAIVVALLENHPERRPVDTGLEELVALVTALPGFEDDPGLVTDRILYDILTTWYEESLSGASAAS